MSKDTSSVRATVFNKGTVVMYVKDGYREMAVVTKVDRGLSPPAYTIQVWRRRIKTMVD